MKENSREQPDEFQLVTQDRYRSTCIDKCVLIVVRGDDIVITSATCDEQSSFIYSMKHPKKLTRFGKDHFESSRFRRILRHSNAVNVVVSSIGSDCLIPDTESAVRIRRVRGILTFRGDFEDDIVAFDLIPQTYVLNNNNNNRESPIRPTPEALSSRSPVRHQNPFE
jgi:hypothetical protein